LYKQFSQAGADILGVSRDSVKSHDNFRNKHQFPFHLLSDSEETLCTQFDVIREKSMYGRQFMGIVRSTFLVGAGGILLQEWRKVRVPGHAENVLDAVRTMT